MSEACSHNCSDCGKTCGERVTQGTIPRAEQNAESNIKRIIGVVSGKGGVGKSLVTALMSVAMQKKGYQTAILDADITGPSVPHMFGVKGKAKLREGRLIPAETGNGIRVISSNMLLERETDPVLWRGPVINNVVKQFYTEVCWGDVDYMFVDMPPGTGDVALTVFQSLPVDGILVVTSPQQMVEMIVEKALHMAERMQVPVLGLVENLSYYECPDCHKRHAVFGESTVEEQAKRHNISWTVRLPIEPGLAALCDAGRIDTFDGDWLDELAAQIETLG